MTDKLSALFDLPDLVETVPPDPPTYCPSALDIIALTAANTAIDKIDAALPSVMGLDSSDSELDELAVLARDTFKSLVDLSMNVEARLSGPILQSAAILMGHAITARTAKIDKKLKIIDLQIRKSRLDQTAQASGDAGNTVIDGQAIPFDRNVLLRDILSVQAAIVSDDTQAGTEKINI